MTSRYPQAPAAAAGPAGLPFIVEVGPSNFPVTNEDGTALDPSLADYAAPAGGGGIRLWNTDRSKYVTIYLNDGGNQLNLGVNNGSQGVYLNTTAFNFQQMALVEYILRYTALTAAAGTMQAQESGRVYSNVGASGTITQPIGLPTSGSVFSFIRVADHPFRIYSANSEQIVVPGTIGGAGKYLELTQIGASVKLIRVTGYLIALNISGTYSVEP